MITNLSLALVQTLAATGQANCGDGSSCDTGLPVVAAGSGQLHQILSIVFGVFAALAVLMIVVGGLQYVTSQGNPQQAAKARGTIIYATVGLVIAISAETIVAFVLGKL